VKRTTQSAELLHQALELHRAGQPKAAERLYQQLLRRDPDSVDALNLYGLLRYQQGDIEGGVGSISRAIELQPDFVDAYLNLGNILLQLGGIDEAHACYRRAAELAPQRLDVISNLGITLRHLGRFDESERLLGRVVERVPEMATAHYNLGNTCSQSGRHQAARQAYRRAIELDPLLTSAYEPYARMCYITGQPQEARDLFERRLALEPDNEVLRHIHAALSGSELPPRANDQYIRHSFDSYAEGFEQSLARLGYQGPELLRQTLGRWLPQAGPNRVVLDAGCGTGLGAAVLRPLARRLVGVDLSEGMLRQARAKQCYDELCCAEIVGFLRQRAAGFDLVVALDTLVYFGDLGQVSQAVHQALKPGGLFLFTLEAMEGEGEFCLNPHGRYAHSRAHVEASLRTAGFEILELRETVIRRELEADVRGWIGVGRRPDGQVVGAASGTDQLRSARRNPPAR